MSSDLALKDYYESYWSREQPSPLGDPLAPRRLALLRESLSSTTAGRALDVGCGRGDVVAALARDGLSAVGMDIAGRALELAREAHPGCRFLEHSAEALPWPVEPASLDLVVAFEVIEHLLEPRRLLLGACEALRPGGHLALTTPYHGLLKNIVLAVAAFDRHFAVDGDHIRFFSDRALRRLLAESGFAVERVRHYGRILGLWAGVFVWARRES